MTDPDLEAFEQARRVVQGELDNATRLRKELAECEQLLDARANELMVARHELEEAMAALEEGERIIAGLTDAHDAILAIRDERIAALKEIGTLEAACCAKAERQRDALLEAAEGLIVELLIVGRMPFRSEAVEAARNAIKEARS